MTIAIAAIARRQILQRGIYRIPSMFSHNYSYHRHISCNRIHNVLITKNLSTRSKSTSSNSNSNNNRQRHQNYSSNWIDEDTKHMTPSEAHLIKQYTTQPQTSASLQTLLLTGRGEYLHKTFKQQPEAHAGHDDFDRCATELVLMQVAGFLRRELPIRFAHRISDLDNTPFMSEMGSVQQVKQLYLQSFHELIERPEKVQSVEDEVAFAKLVEDIYERHSSVLVTMARGAFELRKSIRDKSLKNKDDSVIDYDTMEDMHEFLDKFYVSRIGIRVLIGQYLALRQAPVENYTGMICNVTSPCQVVQQAIDDATFMCTRKYGDAPDVIISGFVYRILNEIMTMSCLMFAFDIGIGDWI